jgi:hypothetical protein
MTFVTNDSTLNRGLDATKQALRDLQGFYKISKQLSIWDLPQSQLHKQSSQKQLDNSPTTRISIIPLQLHNSATPTGLAMSEVLCG